METREQAKQLAMSDIGLTEFEADTAIDECLPEIQSGDFCEDCHCRLTPGNTETFGIDEYCTGCWTKFADHLQLAMSCKDCIVKHGQEFQSTFGLDIRRFMSGVHFLVGFDIVGFDEHLKTPDGISLSDHVKTKYGDRAEELIREILKYPATN